MRHSILLIIALLNTLCGYSRTTIMIAAAANVRDAMEEIRAQFMESNPNIVVNANYGASGVLTQQIINGAGYDLFLSADEAYAIKLHAEGYGVGGVKPYACGKLVLHSRSIDVEKMGFKALEQSSVHTIAVANPKFATYGERAVEMLQKTGVYEAIKSKIIYGENIGATAQYIFTQNAEMGFVALSQIKSPSAQNGGYSHIIPDSLYRPIVQSCILIKQSPTKPEAHLFREYMLGAEAAKVWRKYGYESPE